MRIGDVEVGKEYAADPKWAHGVLSRARFRVERIETREMPRHDRWAWTSRGQTRTENRRGTVLQRLDPGTGEPTGEPRWYEGARLLGQPWEEYAAERDAQKAIDDRREAALERLAAAVEYVLSKSRTDVRLTYSSGDITVILNEETANELAGWMENRQ